MAVCETFIQGADFMYAISHTLGTAMVSDSFQALGAITIVIEPDPSGKLLLTCENIGLTITGEYIGSLLEEAKEAICTASAKQQIPLNVFGSEDGRTEWLAEIALEELRVQRTNLMAQQFPLMLLEVSMGGLFSARPSHDCDCYGADDSLYDAWERLEERAYQSLEFLGPTAIDWLAFVDSIAYGYDDGWGRRKKWERWGILPKGYKLRTAEIQSYRDSDPDWVALNSSDP